MATSATEQETTVWAYAGEQAGQAHSDEETGSVSSEEGKKGTVGISRKATLIIGGLAATAIFLALTFFVVNSIVQTQNVKASRRDNENPSAVVPEGGATTAPAAAVAEPSETEAPTVAPATTAALPAAVVVPETTLPPATPAPTTTEPEVDTCYDLYSKMTVNPLQFYPDNPDSAAYGFTTCKLCTLGNMSCTSTLHGGQSNLIAAHIHLATTPHEAEAADGNTQEGPPVVNFCGNNARGLIADGTLYPEDCGHWDENGAAHSANMKGVIVRATNRGFTQSIRVKDIADNPQRSGRQVHGSAKRMQGGS